MIQAEKHAAFAALHAPGAPVVLFNAWDAGSARIVAEAGAKAIATGSYSVAGAQGFEDGEDAPLDIVVDNAARIVAAVDLPVTVDFETGYGASPEACGASLLRLLEVGVIGVNIEDRLLDAPDLRPVEAQADRLRALAAARSPDGVGAWINARTDVFLQSTPDQHAGLVEAALERGAAYAEAGGDSLFVPGLRDLDLIARVCEGASLPVNVMAGGKGPAIADLAAAGVARVSFGGHPWRLAMAALKDAAAALY
ncbi:MAG: isocitrate lyase/phosphoenolpyruvate mutase family protein [Pseudomonadota bacterium]